MSGFPQILRCEETGRCWQVAHWPEAGVRLSVTGSQLSVGGRDGLVALKRGEVVVTVQVETIFETYTVVC